MYFCVRQLTTTGVRFRRMTGVLIVVLVIAALWAGNRLMTGISKP
jgi:hypothetical protein